jgi:hypothetical protein
MKMGKLIFFYNHRLHGYLPRNQDEHISSLGLEPLPPERSTSRLPLIEAAATFGRMEHMKTN